MQFSSRYVEFPKKNLLLLRRAIKDEVLTSVTWRQNGTTNAQLNTLPETTVDSNPAPVDR